VWERRLERLPEVTLGGGAVRIAVADDPIARLFGLAWMSPRPRPSSPPAIRALLLPDCRSVHTFGMRFPLDLIWLDPTGDLHDVDANVPPRRLRRCPGAAAVVETRAGLGAHVFAAIARSRIRL
jgi:uncharacterized membrane protein (UPF0127 family)